MALILIWYGTVQKVRVFRSLQDLGGRFIIVHNFSLNSVNYTTNMQWS